MDVVAPCHRAAGLLSVALFLPGCACFGSSSEDRAMCAGFVLLATAPVLVPALAVASAIPPRPRVQIESIETLAHVGGERVGPRVSAVGVGGDGRLVFRDAQGAAVASGIAACPPGRPRPPQGAAIGADAPPGPGAIAFAPFDDAALQRPSLREVRVSVPRTRDARSVAIPVSAEAHAREARQVFALPCGPEGRAVLVVADAVEAEATGVEVFEVAFRRTLQR
jgi:hypothetical protein